MATTYFLSQAVSDLSIGGAFTHTLHTATGTPSTDTVTASPGSGVNQGHYATADGPGVVGTSTGTFTAEVNVTVAASGTNARMRLLRVNAAGVTQATSASTAYQSTATTGIKTFSLTNPALGTWAAGNRYVVIIEVQNTNAHGSSVGPTWATLTTDSEVGTPWSLATVHQRSVALSATSNIDSTSTFFTTIERSAALSATSSIASAGGVPVVPNIIFAEDFEGTGYENSWSEAVSGTSVIDEDFDATAVTGSPVNWGAQCLQVVRGDTNPQTVHTLAAAQATFYYRCEAILESHGMDTDDALVFAGIRSDVAATLIQATWRTDGTGALNLRIQVAASTPGTGFTSYDTAVVSLDTPYRIEFLWDSVADVYEVRVDGISIGSGALTSTSAATSVADIRVGGFAAHPATYYVDRLAGADNTWVEDAQSLSVLERSAAISATSDIATSWHLAHAWSSAVQETTEADVAAHERAVALSATSLIASAAESFSVVERSAAFAGTASLEATGQRDLLRSAALGATSGIASSGTFLSVIERSVALSATADIVSAGVGETPGADLERSVSFGATGLIAAIGQLEALRSASLTAAGGIAASGEFFSVIERSAAFSATTDIQATPQRDLLRSVQISAASDISTTGELSGTVERSAAISASTTIAATGQRDLLRAVSLSATSDIATTASQLAPA